MASWNTDVLEQLMQMGIDVPIAQEASRRFQDIERAVNWAFDHGQTVSLSSDVDCTSKTMTILGY